MSPVEDRLRDLGITLPESAPPLAKYVGAVRAGNLVFVSGHGPMKDGKVAFAGKLGRDLDVAAGRDAARLVMLNCLASLKAEVGDLDRVSRVVKLLGMVNSTADFCDQPRVIDAASELLDEVFGARGRHARSAVGMAALPFNIAVEIEMVVEVSGEQGELGVQS